MLLKPPTTKFEETLIPPPEITQPAAESMLAQLGLVKRKLESTSTQEILKNNDLGVADTLEYLGDLIKSSQSDAIRIQAVKMLMEMHQLLKPVQTGSGMIVNVNIVDPESVNKINPILVPRPEAALIPISPDLELQNA